MKTLAALSSAGLLFLVGCGTETKTFVANQAVVPADDDPTATQDFDGDGEVDNEIGGIEVALGLAGLQLEDVLNTAIDDGTVLIAADVTSKNFADDDKKVTVEAYLAAVAGGAAPLFDGTDVIAPDGDTFVFNDPIIAGGNLSTGQSNFVFALPLAAGAEPTLLSFQRAVFTGNVSGDNIAGGSLSGTIDSVDFAVALSDIGDFLNDLVVSTSADNNGGTAVSCVSDVDNDRTSADCPAGQECSANNGVDSGSCLPIDNGLFQALDLLDANRNGQLEAVFNAGTKEFDVNELGLLFDTPGPLDTTAPVGALGSLFSLDLVAGDGVNDSMPLGIKFDAVKATR